MTNHLKQHPTDPLTCGGAGLNAIAVKCGEQLSTSIAFPTMIIKVNHLKQYLTDYLAWADSGESITVFDTSSALCGNIAPWVARSILVAEQWDVWTDIVTDLANELRIDGLNTYYPFGEELYHMERFNKSHHKNPVRLEWIRQTIKSI